MSLKYTANTLKKMEQLFQESGFKIRYEKGRFNSGFCVLEERKIVVINRFLDLESKIQALIDILPDLNLDKDSLSTEMQKWFLQVIKEEDQTGSIQTKMNL